MGRLMQNSKDLGSGLARRWLTGKVEDRFLSALAIVRLGLADLDVQDVDHQHPRGSAFRL